MNFKKMVFSEKEPKTFENTHQIPSESLSCDDLIRQYNFHKGQVRLEIADGASQKIVVPEDFARDASYRQGEAIVYTGMALEHLAGTYIPLEELIRAFEPDLSGDEAAGHEKLLNSRCLFREFPLLIFNPVETIQVNIFGGSHCPEGLTLCLLGNKDLSSEKIALYQLAVARLYWGPIKWTEQQTRHVLGLGDGLIVREMDDCAASNVTFRGSQEALVGALEDLGIEVVGREINVAVSTPHALLLLVEDAKQSKLPTVINVGVTGDFGLTTGVGPAREGRNYITRGPNDIGFSQEVVIEDFDDQAHEVGELKIGETENIFAVGDMGARSVRVGSTPWGNCRRDGWRGKRSDAVLHWALNLGSSSNILTVSYANGGFVPTAAAWYIDEHKRFGLNLGLAKELTIMATAKRLNDSKGLGVIFDHFMGPLREFAREK